MKYLINEAFYIWATFDPYIEDYLKKLMEQPIVNFMVLISYPI